MSQSSNSQRDRRAKAPPQSSQDRQPGKDARSRRAAAGGTDTSQRFDPSQFTVSSEGLVSITKRRLPVSSSTPVGIIGAYSGATSPTLLISGGILVLQIALNNVIYPSWRVPGDSKLGAGGTLELFFTSTGAASVTAKVEAFHITTGSTIPTSPNTTETKSVSIDGGKSAMLPFDIGSGAPTSSVNFRITFTSVGSGTAPLLHAASLAYLSEYGHTHSEARS